MKRLMLIVAFIAASFINANAQNFYIENDHLLWQKFYGSDMNANDILKAMLMSGRFKNIQVVDDSFIAATLDIIDVDYERLGYKRMSLPLYISNNYFGPANVIVQVKEGKYLVTVNNIILSEHPNSALGGTLDFYAVDKYGFTSTFVQYGAPIYDAILRECVTFERVNEDW